jgi:hypothetical protein
MVLQQSYAASWAAVGTSAAANCDAQSGDLLRLTFGYVTAANESNVLSQGICRAAAGFPASQTCSYDGLNCLRSMAESALTLRNPLRACGLREVAVEGSERQESCRMRRCEHQAIRKAQRRTGAEPPQRRFNYGVFQNDKLLVVEQRFHGPGHHVSNSSRSRDGAARLPHWPH